MHVDNELLLKVAKNAKLRLTPEELAEFTPQLKEILNAFSQLDTIDTKNTAISIQPIPVKNALRDDTPGTCLPQDVILNNTTHKKNGYFLGPKAL